MSPSAVKDLRAMFGSARDQGPRPTCLAFAISDMHAVARGNWQPLSAEYLFYRAQTDAGRPPTSGALLPVILHALQSNGQPCETKWSYLVQLPADLAAWQPPVEIGPLFRRESTTISEDLEAILGELNSDRPVLLLLNLSSSFYSATKDVIDVSPSSMPDPQRPHAVIAVGHGQIEGQRTLLIRNSWGSGWGVSGYAWITESFFIAGVFGAAVLGGIPSVSSTSVAA